MTAAEVRQAFLDFFKSKGHEIVPSAPIVVKNDPTLMFTNAGMNQFKDLFLGNEQPKHKRVADTQKCLRVSGKHNDLEEVGVDTYHHTMFEMLGNWSFGDYFKKEAIEWAWELLTKVYKLPEDRLYVTVFEGDKKEGLAFDQESFDNWTKWIAKDRILNGNKKDNFWEMGDTGPCGPCSEIHIDLRPDAERKAKDGKELVNNDHPQVIEIWNNVFMEFNRKADGSLEKLPAQHVDTGMGFERLVRAIEGKSSNYDTDVFVPTIQFIEKHANIKYTFADSKSDIAMRVLADHIRAISFCIADGQLPSNNGAGYVVRRILRRAVRYQYQFLNLKEAFLCKLVDVIAESFKNVFPDLHTQKDFVAKVIMEEEQTFLKTLQSGLSRMEVFCFENGPLIRTAKALDRRLTENAEIFSHDTQLFSNYNPDLIFNFTTRDFTLQLTQETEDSTSEIDGSRGITGISYKCVLQGHRIPARYGNRLDFLKNNQVVITENEPIPGTFVFQLYDTYGFPIDLTRLIAKEQGFEVDEKGFEEELQKQKNRSRKATLLSAGDWMVIENKDTPTEFVGYDETYVPEVRVRKWRKVSNKGKDEYQIVLDKTPFYPEGGGQVGDKGSLVQQVLDESAPEGYRYQNINILDTKKENNLIIHIADQEPQFPTFQAGINMGERMQTEMNHSATHLAHAALREVLGTHVEQKGSLVNSEHLRFDFSHFAAMTDDDVAAVEHIVNMKVRDGMALDERRNVPIEEAREMGAMMLFGEKYGDRVRVITFGDSKELCGGTHVKNTAQIGYFKIMSESAVAAGVRRIEAITGFHFEEYLRETEKKMKDLRDLLKTKDLKRSVEQLMADKAELQKKLEQFETEKTGRLKQDLLSRVKNVNGVNVLTEMVEVPSAEQLKNLSFQLKGEVSNLFCVLGCTLNEKPMLSVIISDNLVADKKLHAGNIVKELAKDIKGGGGGQPFYATAGGNDTAGLKGAVSKAASMV